MQTNTATHVHTDQSQIPVQRRILGFFLVICGGALWGLSGTAAQRLFQVDGFTVPWLVCVRMGGSGILLILISLAAGRRPFAIFCSSRAIMQLLIFTVFGLFAVQYTYFAAVSTGNAATATFLQYMGPLFITVYMAMRMKQWPRKVELLAISLALFGTFLLVTGGSLSTFAVPWQCAVWGLMSALALAFYTMYPNRLTARFGLGPVAGWAMLLGSVCAGLIAPPWQLRTQHWSFEAAALVVFVVFFGTFVAFYVYLASMRHITPTETSLLGGVEPLSAAFAATIWLHTSFTAVMATGGLCILCTVALLGLSKSKS
jgi:drug/metabolite transporter (DMT)-like permease